MRYKDIKQHKPRVNENRIKNICNKCSVEYVGIQFVTLVMFNDKKLHTTLSLRLEDFNYNNVINLLTKKGLR